jgi:glycosyltransferase involved in cell wall biosynthesis
MRIAQVVPAGAHPDGGVVVVIVQLAVHLARIGHDVEVWLLRPWSGEAADAHARELAMQNVPIILPPAGEPGGYAALAARHVHIVHLHSAFTPPNALLSWRLRAPYVVSPHGGYAPASLTRSGVRKTLYKHLVERRVLRHADLQVALTDTEAEELRSFGARGPVTVIPNGVTSPPEVDGAAFRHELGINPGSRLLVFVGRLDVFHKGLDLLVEAVATAPNWHAALIGPEFRDGGAWLQRRARTLGVHARLVLSGPRHGRALHEAFAAADLFALTSRWEGLPMSLLEALSHGTPALVTPAVDRLVPVADAGAGWVAAPQELGAVLRELEHLEPAAWRARADRARALAARYEWTAVARRYEAAYRQVLGTSAPRSAT